MLWLMTELYMLCIGATIMAKIVLIIIFALFVFSIIGIISTINFFIKRRQPKETPEEKWRRTGRI